MMTQKEFWTTVILVMAGMGSLGGVINFLLSKKDDAENSNFWRSFLLGIGASSLVPLFLNMISSNLLELIRGNQNTPADTSKILVFAGFCLVAAISSSAFIRTLSERVLAEAQQAKQGVREVREEFEPIKERLTEPPSEQETGASPASVTPGVADSATALDENAGKVLRAFLQKPWVFRTRTGLARDAGLEKAQVNNLVEELKRIGCVNSRTITNQSGEKKTRWYITDKGREEIGEG